jgi:hypothetical protein
MNRFLIRAIALLFLALPAQGAPLSGSRTIGPTGDYASLTAAIADIQTQTLGGPLVLELQSAYVSTVEAFPLVFTNLTTTVTNTLTLRPQTGATGLSISSANTTKATVDLDGAQFFTIDGRPGGAGTAKQLTIANTSTSGIALRFINEASSNTIRHLTLRGVNTNSYGGGTVVFRGTTGPNGNDNNTITFCDIGDGASTPANGIFAEGSWTTTEQYNSGNAVTNCNVFNFYRSNAVDAAGIHLSSANTGWTISGNSFYQTASRAGVSAKVQAIYLYNDSETGHSVTGNFIGGTAPNAGGTAWTTTGTTLPYVFVGIWVRVGGDAVTSIQGNVIRNFAWTSSSNATIQPGVWSGIYVEHGEVNIGTITGNTIGSGTGTGSIAVVTSGSGGTTFGISSNSGRPVTISNNSIGSLNAGGTTTGIAASLTGIRVTQGTNTISGNTIGSTTTANSLFSTTTVSTGAAQLVTGIEVANGSSSTNTITGNTVANLQNRSTQTSGLIRGILTSAGFNTISGNTVRNLTGASRSTGPSVAGIWAGSTSSGQTVSQNVVHSLSNISNVSVLPPQNFAVAVAGIYFAGGVNGPNLIERNLVHSLSLDSENASAELSGLRFEFGSTFTAQNNLVRLGLDAGGNSVSGGATVIGLHDDDNGASRPRNFIHNSVYVGGTATSGTANSFAYSSTSQSNVRDIRNNIFFNARSNSGGTGKHYAMANGSVTSPPPGLTSDNNIVYATGFGGVLVRFNGADYTTLGAWQAVTGLDGASLSADPRFVNATGTSATVDLHLRASNPAEGRGVLIGAVTNDFDGQTRSSLTPVDIGADAGNFTYDPPPSITYPLLSNGTTANRILTGWATIVDDNGSVSGGANAPRLYYKTATDADAFVGNTAADNGWKYVTATNGSSPYSFTIDYSIIQGGVVTVGETIQYFVVAQDASNNLSSSPAIATASGDPPVQNITARPRTGIHSYNIVATIGGSVTVGSGGSYPSLSGAGGLFAALNAGALTGDLTVNLAGNTTENGSVQLNATSSNAYPPFSVTIRPDSATMRTISGSAANGLILLNGTQRVTFDGRFGGSGRYLTFRNTSNNSSASTFVFINDASNNTVRNCVIEGMSAAFGVVSFRTGVITGNDDNTVTENQIRDRSDAAGVPAYLVGSIGTSDWIANSGNLISNNELFNFTSMGVGVLSNSRSWTITGNTIYQTAARTTALTGISLNSLGTNAILGNTIRDLTTTGETTGINLTSLFMYGPANTAVAGNRLWNLGNRPGSTNYVRGIYSQQGADQSVTVVNNMVALGSSGTTAQSLSGIYDNGETGSTAITAFNTVLLTGTGGASRDTRAYSYGGNSTATVMNNIFLNLRTGGSNHFAANFSTTSAGTLAMDYNVYAGTGVATAANFFDSGDAIFSTGTPISHAQWQANVPGDTHSSAGNPGGNYTSAMFVAPATGDLHLVLGGNVLVNNKGTPVVGVTQDFDSELRNSVAPMIGADEYLVPDIIVTQTSPLSDGGTVDFGSVETGSTGAITTFTITNPGNAALTNLAVTVDGTNADLFSVSALSNTEIAPGGGNATFTVTFSPSLIGAHTAALHLTSNLSGAINPFDIVITGTGTSTNANLSDLTLSSGTLDPGFSAATTSYTASVSNATTSITVTPTRAQANATIEARVNGGSFSPVTSGSPSGLLALNIGSNTVQVRVTAYAGNTMIYTATVTRRALPVVIPNPTTSITATGAILSGNLTAAGAAAITERGIVYSASAVNSDPLIGGAGVTKLTDSGTSGAFTAPATGLAGGTTYSFKGYAINADGTFYSQVAFFVTDTVVDFVSGSAEYEREILPGGRQVFHFTLDGPRVVSLATLGGAALRAELYDGEGQLIASFTGNENFDLEETLLPGDYSLHVFRGAGGGQAQSFELTIDASTVASSRPDVAVGPSPAALLGVGLYAPSSQLVSLISKNALPVTGYATLANRGNLPDVITVSGSGGSALFTVSYAGPAGNITAGILAGTYRTREIDENDAPVPIRATITPNKKKLTKKKKGRKPLILKKTHTILIRAVSTFDPATADSASISAQTK